GVLSTAVSDATSIAGGVISTAASDVSSIATVVTSDAGGVFSTVTSDVGVITSAVSTIGPETTSTTGGLSTGLPDPTSTFAPGATTLPGLGTGTGTAPEATGTDSSNSGNGNGNGDDGRNRDGNGSGGKSLTLQGTDVSGSSPLVSPSGITISGLSSSSAGLLSHGALSSIIGGSTLTVPASSTLASHTIEEGYKFVLGRREHNPRTHGGNGDGNANATAAHHGGLSAGVIAAIAVVSSLAFIALCIFGMRRWHRQRRTQRIEQWGRRTGALTFLAGGARTSEKDEGTTSARSSFGTTNDHGLRPFTPMPMPSMGASLFEPSASDSSLFYTPLSSVVHDGGTVSTAEGATNAPAAGLGAAASNLNRRLSGRSSQFSIGSESSHNSDDSNGGQYLLAPPLQPDVMGAQLSPISVRPWSPNERWAFPKPPMAATPTTAATTMTPGAGAEGKESSKLAIPSFSVVPATQPHTPTSLMTFSSGAVSDKTALDPFADPDPDLNPNSEKEARMSMSTSTNGEPSPVVGTVRRASASSVLSEPPAMARTLSSPSASTDGAASSASAEGDALAGVIEFIKRPFAPTLADEMAVQRGDEVRILRSFDDGWARVEKMGTGEKGLIPVDCLRENGEPLPAFFGGQEG
ncbi:hypothetical protein EW145_g5126, partial [Phellinidium pouzarii]